jgi:hypothetical protein
MAHHGNGHTKGCVNVFLCPPECIKLAQHKTEWKRVRSPLLQMGAYRDGLSQWRNRLPRESGRRHHFGSETEVQGEALSFPFG